MTVMVARFPRRPARRGRGGDQRHVGSWTARRDHLGSTGFHDRGRRRDVPWQLEDGAVGKSLTHIDIAEGYGYKMNNTIIY